MKEGSARVCWSIYIYTQTRAWALLQTSSSSFSFLGGLPSFVVRLDFVASWLRLAPTGLENGLLSLS